MSNESEEEILNARVPGIKVPYGWDAGEYASKFFTEIRDNGKILGTRCSSCGKTYIPPRSTCSKCFDHIDEWVELGKQGTLLTYTVVNYEFPLIQPSEPPILYGIIKLDQADTGFVHILDEVDLDDLEPGLRVEAVLKDKDEREGNILDIRYFRPVSD